MKYTFFFKIHEQSKIHAILTLKQFRCNNLTPYWILGRLVADRIDRGNTERCLIVKRLTNDKTKVGNRRPDNQEIV